MVVKKTRKNMKPEERRTQLLDCAQKLFFEVGFENTTVQDIMDAAKVSKGGFYHHYKSKDELLLAVIQRLVGFSVSVLGPIVENKSVPPLDRFRELHMARREFIKASGFFSQPGLMGNLQRPENARLMKQLNDSIFDAVVPMVSLVLQDGIDDGVFDILNANATAEIILNLSDSIQGPLEALVSAMGTDKQQEAALYLNDFAKTLAGSVARVLGLQADQIEFGWEELASDLLGTTP